MHIQAFDVWGNVTHHHFPGKGGTSIRKKNDQRTQSASKGWSILFVPDVKRYRSWRWHPAGICNSFSHATLTTASGKGLCANRGTVPEGTRERKHPIPTHLISISPPAVYKCHEQESQQCCKGSLGISPTPLQGPSQGALHSLVLLQRSSAEFLCFLLPGPKLHHSWAVRTSPSPLGWETETEGKMMCGESTKLEMSKTAVFLQKCTWVTLWGGGQHGSSSAISSLWLSGTKPAVGWGHHRNKLVLKMLWCFVLGAVEVYFVSTDTSHA